MSQVDSLKVDLVEDLDKLRVLIKKYQDEATRAGERGDPESLRNALVRLSRTNAALGAKASRAKYIARLADRVYRSHRDSKKLAYISDGNAIGKAESMAYVHKSTDELFNAYNECQLLADEADDLAYKTDTFLKMAQSSLSIIKNDIQGSP